jgi:hypothetical protein
VLPPVAAPNQACLKERGRVKRHGRSPFTGPLDVQFLTEQGSLEWQSGANEIGFCVGAPVNRAVD